MLFKIHKKALTSESGISYNEEKYLDKVAKVISFGNVNCRNETGVILAIQRLEESSVRSNVKNKGFQMSINPAEGEELTDHTAAKLAKDIMTKMGYGEQPWILYKHFDIDRVHYHLVSTRVKKDSHLISNDNDKYKIRQIGIALSEKYGYIYGKSNKEIEIEPGIQPFQPGKKHATQRIRELVHSAAIEYKYRDIYEFSKIMETLGVKIGRVQTRDGKNYRWVFKGLDENGVPCTKYIGRIDNINPKKGFPGLEQNVRYLGQKNVISKLSYDNKKKIQKNAMKAISIAKSKAVPEEVFCKYMHKTGVDIKLERNETTKQIEDVLIIDHDSRQLLHNEDLDFLLNIQMLNENIPYRESKKGRTRKLKKTPSIRNLTKNVASQETKISEKAQVSEHELHTQLFQD